MFEICYCHHYCVRCCYYDISIILLYLSFLSTFKVYPVILVLGYATVLCFGTFSILPEIYLVRSYVETFRIVNIAQQGYDLSLS